MLVVATCYVDAGFFLQNCYNFESRFELFVFMKAYTLSFLHFCKKNTLSFLLIEYSLEVPQNS